jgi:hypothetical protein
VKRAVTAGLPAPPAPGVAAPEAAAPGATAPEAAPRAAVPPQVESIKVSDLMTLILSGGDFDIEAVTSSKQAVGHMTTLWEWKITPLRSGLKTLTLCVSVDVKTVEGFQPSTDACPFERQIRVRVNPVFSTQQFVKSNLPWLGPALIGAAGGGTWLQLIKRRKKKPPPKHAPATP